MGAGLGEEGDEEGEEEGDEEGEEDVAGPSEAELLRFFRTAFEKLEAIKLDLANAHLAQLLSQDTPHPHPNPNPYP